MPLLQIRNLSHFFGGLRAVYDYNLTLEDGELVGLIGPNGAGKTTIFNLVTGAYKPSEGEVQLNGDNLVGLRPHQITSKGIARTFQTIRLWSELSVLDNVCIAHAARIKYSLLDSILRRGGFREEERQIKKQAQELLAVLGLGEHGHVFMVDRQRVAALGHGQLCHTRQSRIDIQVQGHLAGAVLIGGDTGGVIEQVHIQHRGKDLADTVDDGIGIGSQRGR